jgi:hypothetical protein
MSHKNTLKMKVVDLIENYNFDIKVPSFDIIENNIIFLIRQALVHDYYTAKILYYFFEHLNDLKSKISKL